MPDVIQAAVAGKAKELQDQQRLQLLTGKDSKGHHLGEYKSRKYAEEKFAKNKLAGFGFMDWRLTGDFFRDVFINLRGSSVFISSTDKKLDRLLKINKDAFGLNKENSSEFSLYHIRPVANRIIRKQITK